MAERNTKIAQQRALSAAKEERKDERTPIVKKAAASGEKKSNFVPSELRPD